jgi:hypothetical protein
MDRKARVILARGGRRLYASKCRDELRLAFREGRRNKRWRRFTLNLESFDCRPLPRQTKKALKLGLRKGTSFAGVSSSESAATSAANAVMVARAIAHSTRCGARGRSCRPSGPCRASRPSHLYPVLRLIPKRAHRGRARSGARDERGRFVMPTKISDDEQ